MIRRTFVTSRSTLSPPNSNENIVYQAFAAWVQQAMPDVGGPKLHICLVPETRRRRAATFHWRLS
jgi:hypothetical protein